MNTQKKLKNLVIESCPMEDSEDALCLQMKQEEQNKIQTCPFEEFEDLTEAALLNK